MSLIRQKRPNPLMALPAKDEDFSEFKKLARKTLTPTSATTPSVAVYGRGTNMICLLTPTTVFFDDDTCTTDSIPSPSLTALFCDFSHRNNVRRDSSKLFQSKDVQDEHKDHDISLDNHIDSRDRSVDRSPIQTTSVDDILKFQFPSDLHDHDHDIDMYDSSIESLLPAGATGILSILDNHERKFRVRYNPSLIARGSLDAQWQEAEEETRELDSKYVFSADESLHVAMQLEVIESVSGLRQMISQAEQLDTQTMTPPASLELNPSDDHLKGHPLEIPGDDDIASSLDSLPYSEYDDVHDHSVEPEPVKPETTAVVKKEFTGRDPTRPILAQIVEGSEMWFKLVQVKKGVHTCSHCSGKFSTLLELAQHLDAHKIVRPFFCSHDDCPWKLVGFQRRPQCARHLKTLHGEGFVCPHCGKRVVRKDSLRRHIQRVHIHKKPRGPYRMTGKRRRKRGQDIKEDEDDGQNLEIDPLILT